MIVAQPRPDETETIAALRALNVLDTKPEVAFDALVRAASLVCGAPISLISLVDVNRQWFKANVGLPGVTETSRDSSFCAHAVLGETLFEVPDASRDPRFADNPLVLGDPHIRFYAGIPLRLHDGRKVGSLCVIDRQPRQLSAQQREVLKALGEAAAHALEGRRAMEATAAAAMEIAQSEALLAEERQRLAAVIDAANVGTWEINLLTGEARVSERWAQITGETVAELGPLTIQNGMGRVHPDDAERVRRTFTEHVKGTSDRYSTELRVRHKDGRWVPVVDHARVMSRTADGQVKWVVGARIDVERRKQSEERLRRSEDFLRRTGRVAGVGGWELDVATRKVTWSDETALIHGKPAGYQPTFEEARSYYTPEALAEIGAAVDRCLAGGPGWDLELPQTRADGVPIWIRSVGS
ncbi:MAG: PAS domain-containing protein, partial [Deltaproteobacteria bacterium]|nr:PAS domain-containing protein [Deltaproteobacteria bacterium]